MSETLVMRMISDILGGSGAISPMLRDSEGNDRGHLIVTARLRGLQASTKSKLGVKEEAQRFINVEDKKAQGGSGTVTLTGIIGTTFGNPEASLGGYSNVGGGANVAATLSSERSHDATTGSGDIRGMVIWGNSILYLSDLEFTVQVVAPDASFGEPGFLVGVPMTGRRKQSMRACASLNCTRHGSRPCSSRPSRVCPASFPSMTSPMRTGGRISRGTRRSRWPPGRASALPGSATCKAPSMCCPSCCG